MSEIPAKVGKYDVQEVLGRGSMGVVYRGHDPFVDRAVAIKVSTGLADTQGGSEDISRRLFVNEARAAGRLDHPHILKVYEAGEDASGQPYMVMEYIDGGATLKSLAGRGRTLPLRQALKLVAQTAEALAHAHDNDVMHRDVKPANVMVTEDGRAKLGDFGIARRLSDSHEHVAGWFGSPLYMSPEQARDKPLTAQSDLFSLGAVLYELLTGAPPFTAKGLSGVIKRVTTEDPAPPSSVRPEVPEAVDRIVLRMLAKDLAVRYRTGHEIAADIGRVLLEMSQAGLSLSTEERLTVLQGLSFFEGFTAAELKEVVRVASWRQYESGEVLFAENDDAQAFFVVVQGAAELTIGGRRVAAYEAGDCFGEMGYLSGQKRLGAVSARRPLRVIAIDMPLQKWASLPCQLRIKGRFQEVLIARLSKAFRELAS